MKYILCVVYDVYAPASLKLLELLGLAHMEFQLIPQRSQRPIHALWEITL
jgi:hypothetical protein